MSIGVRHHLRARLPFPTYFLFCSVLSPLAISFAISIAPVESLGPAAEITVGKDTSGTEGIESLQHWANEHEQVSGPCE